MLTTAVYYIYYMKGKGEEYASWNVSREETIVFGRFCGGFGTFSVFGGFFCENLNQWSAGT